MHELTEMIYEDMKPALGVTEPGAIAYAVAVAKEHIKSSENADGEVSAASKYVRISLKLNSGMFKNAFTCGIPGTGEVGNYYAACLGFVAADPGKKLQCLEGITDEDVSACKELIDAGAVTVRMTEISSRIFIEAEVRLGMHTATVTIQDSHTNIVKIQQDGETVFEKEARQDESEAEFREHQIHRYTLKELYEYALEVPASEIEFIDEAFTMNTELLEEGIASERATFCKYLLAANGGVRISDDEQKSASLLCNGAIEARVIGLGRPAMSITGSGAHGIIATMPLLASAKVRGCSHEMLLRATALSYLVCMYIKEYSGRLSAFCGCAIAAGSGMACGLVLLRGGDADKMTKTINNMASSITGMICDGGNQGCTMKGVVAVDAAFRSVYLAMSDIYVDSIHGINGRSPEETMKYMGMIASPGMIGTEKTMIDILKMKSDSSGDYPEGDCVYMVKCADGTFYTGWTNDFAARLNVHNMGKGARYTRARRPVVPVYLEYVKDKSSGLRREAAIKKLTRSQKLKLIESEKNELH